MKKCFKDFINLKRVFRLPKKKYPNSKIPVYFVNGISEYRNQPSCSTPGVIAGHSRTIDSVMYSQIPFFALKTTLFVEDFIGNITYFAYYFLLIFDLNHFSTEAVVPTLNRNIFSDVVIDMPEETVQFYITSNMLN